VHITDIGRREPFRRKTYLADVVAYSVIGKGVGGYVEAMDWLLDHLTAGRT
jgi:3-dehydroquinate dehydratase-2